MGNLEAAAATTAKAKSPAPSPRGGHAAQQGEGAVSTSSACFLGLGQDGVWATRHAASQDVGSMNRRKEQRPDPCWYQPQIDSVKGRIPAFDFSEKPKTLPRPKPTGDAAVDSLDMHKMDKTAQSSQSQNQSVDPRMTAGSF